jgi:hypothetical protein
VQNRFNVEDGTRRVLDEEHLTMHAPIRQNMSSARASGQRHRIDLSTATDDSPYALYLRRWLALSAARHHDLLLNIAASSRIGLAPASPPK